MPPGTTLFAAAHWIDVVIDSACAGLGTCGRCKVQVDKGAIGPSAADRELLTADELENGWRLACQAIAHNETVCRVPETTAAPRAATEGLGRSVRLEPSLRKIFVDLPPPSLEDSSSDLERLRQALAAAGHAVDLEPALLRRLPAVLRGARFQITAVLAGRRLVAIEPGDTRSSAYGVAFDVGTTTIVGALLDLDSGRVAAVHSARNRQTPFGADVISRIAHARQSEEQCSELQQAALATLNEVLATLYQATGVDRSEVYEAVAVGNATMLHLLLGVDPGPIAVVPFIPAFTHSLEVGAGELPLDIHPQGRLTSFPLIGAYVGADTVAGLHATDLARSPELRLFIDVGTNSEIALGSEERVLATSAPAGPAFEGGRIRCGMLASAGAIERVELGRAVRLEIIGSGPARGLCGSGLIAVVAELRRSGLLQADGRLRSAEEAAGHPLANHLEEVDGQRAFRLEADVVLTQRDIRELQAAKGAVATGIEALMEHLQVRPENLDEVLLAGAFGSAIDPLSARALGLVPAVAAEKIRFVGNAAVEGAKMGLLSFRERQTAFDLAGRVEYVELSARPDFNERYIANLGFLDLEALN